MSLVTQYLLIAAALVASIGYVLHQRAPVLSRRLRTAMAIPLVLEGRPKWMRRLGQWLAPPLAKSGCSNCNGCGSE